MRARALNTRLAGPVALLSLAAVVFMACDAVTITGPGSGEAQACPVSYSLNFPMGGNLHVNKPASCPMKIAGGTFVPFAAAAGFSQGGVRPNQFVMDVINRLGSVNSVAAYPVWNYNGSWSFQLTTNYFAGTGGFANDAGWDDVRNGVLLDAGVWSYATVHITYRFGSPAVNVSAPSENVGSGIAYSVKGTTDDPLFVSPVSWSWYVDGVLQSTAGPTFDWYGGAPGAQQHIRAIAVDAEGRSHTGDRTVTTCSGSEITC